MKKVTVRVPDRIPVKLKELKGGLPKRLSKSSQDDIVGALLHAATVADTTRALDDYYDDDELWEE